MEGKSVKELKALAKEVLDNKQPQSNINDQPITEIIIPIHTRDGPNQYKIIKLIILG